MAFARIGNPGSPESPAISSPFSIAPETSAHRGADAPLASKSGGWFIKWAMAAVLALLLPGVSPATGLSFQGVVSTLSTGSVTLGLPADITVDTTGKIYIADSSNNRIVRVTPQGVASVIAITGLGTALSGPAGVAVDGSGNLYIADSGNNRVVEIAPSGSGSVVSTQQRDDPWAARRGVGSIGQPLHCRHGRQSDRGSDPGGHSRSLQHHGARYGSEFSDQRGSGPVGRSLYRRFRKQPDCDRGCRRVGGLGSEHYWPGHASEHPDRRGGR